MSRTELPHKTGDGIQCTLFSQRCAKGDSGGPARLVQIRPARPQPRSRGGRKRHCRGWIPGCRFWLVCRCQQYRVSRESHTTYNHVEGTFNQDRFLLSQASAIELHNERSNQASQLPALKAIIPTYPLISFDVLNESRSAFDEAAKASPLLARSVQRINEQQCSTSYEMPDEYWPR